MSKMLWSPTAGTVTLAYRHPNVLFLSKLLFLVALDSFMLMKGEARFIVSTVQACILLMFTTAKQSVQISSITECLQLTGQVLKFSTLCSYYPILMFYIKGHIQ